MCTYVPVCLLFINSRIMYTVARENVARLKFRVFCNSQKFIREMLFREILFANRNYWYTAIVAAKQWTHCLAVTWRCWSTLLNPSPSPTLTVPCQASWSQRQSIVPTERLLPCSLLPVALVQRMTDPGNVCAAHIWSLLLPIKALPDRKQGRPLLLGDELDTAVHTYVERIRKLGSFVNTAIVLGGTKAIIADRDSTLAPGKDWAKSLLSRMGYVKRKATTKGKLQ